MKTVKYLVEILDDAERILSNYADYAEDADYLDEMADCDLYIIREMEQHENEIEKIKSAFEKFRFVNCREPETEDVKILVANDEYIRSVITTSGNMFDVVLYADGTLFDRELMGTRWMAEFLDEGGDAVSVPAVDLNDLPYLPF